MGFSVLTNSCVFFFLALSLLFFFLHFYTVTPPPLSPLPFFFPFFITAMYISSYSLSLSLFFFLNYVGLFFFF